MISENEAVSCTISAAARDVPVDNADQVEQTAPEGSAERVELVRPHIELL